MNSKGIFISLLLCLMVAILSAQSLIINEVMSTNTSTIFDSDGESNDWIELYNNTSENINLKGYFLSDKTGNPDKWKFPNVNIPSGSYLLVWASGKDKVFDNGEIHTNFKINASGEDVILVDSDGSTIINQCQATRLPPDVSVGRKPNHGLDWYFFDKATPSKANTTTAYSEITQPPVFSHQRGFYHNPIDLKLTSDNVQDKIYYTLDGSEPTIHSDLYSSPIHINKTTPVRVLVQRDGALSNFIYTHTYFFENSLNINTISLVTDHDNLWGSNGIYEHYSSGEEKPIHFEYFEAGGAPGFNLNAGIKIHAPDSRSQKSLAIYARAEYGENEINYKIFEEKDIDIFKRLILRNGGNDGAELGKTQIRDVFTHKIYQQINPDYAASAYRPVHVYINGSYWGIYNLREKQDENYIVENYGLDADKIDFLEYDYQEPGIRRTLAGNWNDFDNLKNFVTNNDMSVEANYNVMSDWMDMDNFIDYQITEIFVGNADWCNNNIKFWRPKAAENKWKWVLWDTDYALGTYRETPVGKPDFNFFNMAMTWGGWGNDDYTWLLRNLMNNEGFKYQFISRSHDLLNTVFKPSNTISQFDDMANRIRLDIHNQFDRWGKNISTWEDDLQYTRSYMEQRPGFYCDHLAEKLGFSTVLHEITVDISNTEMGLVQLNSILIDENTPGINPSPYPWTGNYFEDIPVHAKAIPKSGSRFVCWEGINTSTDEEITIQLTDNANLTAIFERNESGVDDDPYNNMQIHLFPVPASDYVNIRITNCQKQKMVLQVTNLMGSILYKQSIEPVYELQSKIDLTHYTPGMYVLIVKLQNGKSIVEKFLVKQQALTSI